MVKYWLEWVITFPLTIKFQYSLNFYLFFTQTIFGIPMNLYIWSHSTDQSNEKDFIEFSINIAFDVYQLITLGVLFILITFHIIQKLSYGLHNITIEFSGRNICILSKIFVTKNPEPWINENIQTVAQLWKIDAWNKQSQKMEQV